jgi:hypothetical protein
MNATKMKQSILSIHDTNMAGDSWRWNFYLERKADGAHTLSYEQIFEDEPLAIDPVNGLRNGADIYDALCSICRTAVIISAIRRSLPLQRKL